MAGGYTNPPYYISAYGIAVKHGYTGTEQQWIDEMWANARASAAAAAESAEDAATAKGGAEAAQTAAEAAQGAAETARDLAAEWAAGEEPGEPGATNNAAYYAAQAAGNADTAADSASDAEAFAAGTRNGQAVTSSDPAYHKNAKYYNDNITAAVADAAGDWLTEHVDPTSEVVIDDSVSIAGAAADAKAVRDLVDELNGEHEGIDRLMREADSFVDLPFTLTDGYYVNYEDGTLAEAVASSATNYINIGAFDHIIYKQRITTSNPVLSGIAFYDRNKTYITGTAARSGQSVGYVEICRNIPTNAVYVRCTTITNTETYGDFTIFGYSEAGRRFDVAVNGVGNANAKLFTRITDITYERGGIVITNGDTAGTALMPSYVRNVGFLSVRAGSTIDVDDGYKFAVNLYTLDDTPVFIAGKSATISGMFTVPFDCKIRFSISDVDNTVQITTDIAEHFVLNLYGMDDALEAKYATAEDLAGAALYTIDGSGFDISYGGINPGGRSNTDKDRLRYIYNGLGGFAVKAGSVITPNAGYKFAVARYTSYNSNSDFELLEFVSMRSTAYTVPSDCFIRIMFATVGDDDLWSEEDGEITLTETGEAAVAGALELSMYGGTVKEEIQKLNDRPSNDIWQAPIRLETEIPLNAMAFHALFADLVEDGKLSRTLLGNQDGDSDYPIYLYTLRHDMKHINPNYGIVSWDGSNELYQRPKIWMDSGIHGNERTTPYALWDFINKLCTKTEYQEMRNAFDWYFVPLVNPWGFSNTAYKNGVANDGNGYTASTKSQYTVTANTASVHNGIRRNSDGVDINRDFSTFATDEAKLIRDALISLTADGRNFVFAVDAHQATNGDDVNVIGAFLSLNYSATAADKALIWSKWMQVGAQAEMIIANDLDRDVVQSVYPWDGTNLATARNYMASYADYSMCFEGGQTCVYYSQSKTWSNPVARTFINTVFHGFLHKLTEHWM